MFPSLSRFIQMTVAVSFMGPHERILIGASRHYTRSNFVSGFLYVVFMVTIVSLWILGLFTSLNSSSYGVKTCGKGNILASNGIVI